jgi:hypothetical protein
MLCHVLTVFLGLSVAAASSTAVADPPTLDVIGYGRATRDGSVNATYPFEYYIPAALRTTPAEQQLWNVLAQNLRLEKVTWALMLNGYFHGYSDRFGDMKVYKEDWTLAEEPAELTAAERELFWGLVKKRYAYTSILKEYYLTMELAGESYDNFYISPQVLAIWQGFEGSLRLFRSELDIAARQFFADKP